MSLMDEFYARPAALEDFYPAGYTNATPLDPPVAFWPLFKSITARIGVGMDAKKELAAIALVCHRALAVLEDRQAGA